LVVPAARGLNHWKVVELEVFEIGLGVLHSVHRTIAEAEHCVQGVLVAAVEMVVRTLASGVGPDFLAYVEWMFREVGSVDLGVAGDASRVGLEVEFGGNRRLLVALAVEALDAEMTDAGLAVLEVAAGVVLGLVVLSSPQTAGMELEVGACVELRVAGEARSVGRGFELGERWVVLVDLAAEALGAELTGPGLAVLGAAAGVVLDLVDLRSPQIAEMEPRIGMAAENGIAGEASFVGFDDFDSESENNFVVLVDLVAEAPGAELTEPAVVVLEVVGAVALGLVE
jgi:hypothetical protein